MRNPLPIPTQEDWLGHKRPVDGDPFYQDFDLETAYRNFYGKTHAEAFALFVDNAIHYQEDVFWMPKRCLGFYLLAYVHYMDSELSHGDSDGANCFFGLVEFRSVDIRNGHPEVREAVIRTLRRVGQAQEWYGADPENYGSFAARSEACLALLGAA
jgi:hypothetical protein